MTKRITKYILYLSIYYKLFMLRICKIRYRLLNILHQYFSLSLLFQVSMLERSLLTLKFLIFLVRVTDSEVSHRHNSIKKYSREKSQLLAFAKF